jgi:hypothetical protein
MHKCPKCPRTFTTKQGVSMHLTMTHGGKPKYPRKETKSKHTKPTRPAGGNPAAGRKTEARRTLTLDAVHEAGNTLVLVDGDGNVWAARMVLKVEDLA